MTKSQLLKEQSIAITDALSLVPRGERAEVREAVEHAYIRGVETLIVALGEEREATSCSYCKVSMGRIIKRFQIES